MLLADDQEDALDLLRSIIEGRLGPDRVTVKAAGDGSRAVELAVAEPPALAILDLHMPHLNGIAAAFAIRQACPPAVLIGASSSREAVADAMMSGTFNDVFVKPYDMERLAPYLEALR